MLETLIPIVPKLLICFLVGSIPFAVIVMASSGIDIRKVGSGNPGFNNVLRVNKPRAIIVLIGDMGKGFLTSWFFWRFLQPGDSINYGWLYGFAAVIGHCYSPFLKFNGGKGVATSGGVMLVLYPGLAGIALTAFAIMRIAGSKLKWKEAGAISSLSAWITFAVLLLWLSGLQHATNAGLMILLLSWQHRQNFRNLLKPT